MSEAHDDPSIVPGLAMLHSNRMEDLREILIDWLKAHPLPPFEDETLLVQSNGIAQWLKLGFAADAGLGISAGISLQLPAHFLWQAYRAVLSETTIPKSSPLDPAPLTWRIYQRLPQLISQNPGLYAPLARFLKDDASQEKRYQLAVQLASLFDQYQVHRADWLNQWHHDPDNYSIRLANSAAGNVALDTEQRWQADLWRHLTSELSDQTQITSRAFLNDRFIAALQAAKIAQKDRPKGIPRRLIVFGISSLPRQSLEAIAALSQMTQVLYFVQNPCQHYWADIIEGKDLLLHTSKRQQRKAQFPASLTEDQLHLHSNPLLAAWGKQGRDFVRLLDEWDDPENTRRIGFQKIDVYHEVPEAQASVLQQVQNAILNLEPLPAAPEARKPVTASDHSIAFHIAHSPQREVEVLHDQLLSLFDDPQGARPKLTPADVIVMVPDIDRYAPHIEAVFGQFASTDARNIPFSLADRKQRGHNPIHVALEYLLGLPEARITSSEILDLLDLDAIQQCFGLAKEHIPLLRRWILESGIRWGLDKGHRDALELGAARSQNTWQFGLDRMLLGYCMGDAADYNDIAPYDEIGGIESAHLGPLCLFMQRIAEFREQLASPATPTDWAQRIENLFAAFFKAGNTADRRSLDRLKISLAQWLEYCHSAQLSEPLPLAVVREAWLSSLDEPDLSQRFLAGRVNFCTLMPMRAIPFKVVCLLGMNDGDFPRSQTQRTFDLMRQPGAYRPGDRAQREDDRYMFLEALLSAREKLLISWVGRNIRDDSSVPASVLVSQLQDYLKAGWRLAQDHQASLLDHLSVHHALQPFSTRYFAAEATDGLFTYAHEWRASAATDQQRADASQDTLLSAPEALESVSLRKLERFLKSPVAYFFNERLSVYFENDASKTEDSECFELNPLQRHVQISNLITEQLAPTQTDEDYARYLSTQRNQGSLPLAGFGENLQQDLATQAKQVASRYQELLKDWEDPLDHPLGLQGLRFQLDHQETVVLDDWLTALRPHRARADRYALIQTRPSDLLTKGKIKYHHLTSLWVQHLAANAAGHSTQSYLVGSDTCLPFAPIPQAEAQAILEELIQAGYAALTAPLPLAPRTAFAWLTAKEDAREQDAQKAYAGDGFHLIGEMEYDAYLRRAYPDFDALINAEIDGKCFDNWVKQLYQPLFDVLTPEGDAP